MRNLTTPPCLSWLACENRRIFLRQGIRGAGLLSAVGMGLSPWALRAQNNGGMVPGRFRGVLIVGETQQEVLPGQMALSYTYNGSLPGSLQEWYEGQTVEMHIVNQLQEPTTVHWHGLDVPPEVDGNPHDPIAPGQLRTVQFVVPTGSAGTYWYHPHTHYTSGRQAGMGLAGPIIVRPRDPGSDPLHTVPERLLMISDLKLATQDGATVIAPNDMLDWMNGREGQHTLVNGQLKPQLRLHAGGRERWRIINACNARHLRLSLPGMRWWLVGTDGGLIERPVAMEDYLLPPAARAEFVVESVENSPGVVQLVTLPYERGQQAMADMVGIQLPQETSRVLLQVDTSSVNRASLQAQPALPARLRDIPDLGRVQARKRVVFSEQMSHSQHGSGAAGDMGQMSNMPDMPDMPGMSHMTGMHQGLATHDTHATHATTTKQTSDKARQPQDDLPQDMAFLINGKKFDMRRIDLRSRVDAVELWELVNQSDMDHPFHLHGTQFQVIERELGGRITPEPFRAWRDVVGIRPQETVRIKTVQRHRGLRMFHCHILEHEDLGMMGQLLVT